MPTARYKFVRDTSIGGFLSGNRPSTDALGAVSNWTSRATGRSYAVLVDEDNNLVVDLTWSETDRAAGTELDDSCRRFGVDRSYVQKSKSGQAHISQFVGKPTAIK